MTLRDETDPAAIVAALATYGLSPEVVAVVVHVPSRLVRAWAPGTIAADRIYSLVELRDLVAALSDSLTPTGVASWLRAPNRCLDGRRPLEELQVGRVDAVRDAAGAFVEGAYL